MGWYSDILHAYPGLADEIERLRLIDEENRKRIRSRATPPVDRNQIKKRGRFIAFKGVLWTEHDGIIDLSVYCPTCEVAMEIIPSETNAKVACPKCDHTGLSPPEK